MRSLMHRADENIIQNLKSKRYRKKKKWKFAKNESTAFYLIKYAKNIWKIDKDLGISIETVYKIM